MTAFLGFAVCVGLPAAVTAMAPVTRISLIREGDVVTVQARQCVFFFIPYLTQQVSPATAVSTQVIEGKIIADGDKQPNAPKGDQRTEDEGVLKIHGPNEQLARIMVSPTSLEPTHRAIDQFLKDPKAQSQNLIVTANWKVGVIAGIPLTVLTLLYLCGVAWSIVRTLFRPVAAK